LLILFFKAKRGEENTLHDCVNKVSTMRMQVKRARCATGEKRSRCPTGEIGYNEKKGRELCRRGREPWVKKIDLGSVIV
jgi:hypothetical protein